MTIMKPKQIIMGRWIAGSNRGQQAVVSDVRTGVLYTLAPDGALLFGSSQEFCADTGESGEALLNLLLPSPRASDLFLGALRESLAAVYSVAKIGRQDTRAWDQLDLYVVDDNEGNAAAVQFLSEGCVGAISNHDPSRDFNFAEAVAMAPLRLRQTLASLCRIPLFQDDGRPRVTAVFWAESGRLRGPEPWWATYLFGAELLRRELLDEEDWKDEAMKHYDLDDATAFAITQITRRAHPLEPIVLTKEEAALLSPHRSAYYDESFQQLLSGGRFTISHRSPEGSDK